MATYQVHIDWDRNGNYTGTYDDVSSYVRSIEAFTGFKEPYTNVAGEKTLRIELDNSDRRFSPDYSSSPLYGKRFRNRPIRFQVINGATTILWTGTTDTITVQTNINGERRAYITATGYKRILDTMQSYVELQVGKSTDLIIAAILAGITIPEARTSGPWILGVTGYTELDTTTILSSNILTSSLETGYLTPSYAGDNWGDGVTPYEAIKQVIEAERGKFFENRTGVMTMYNRNHFISDYLSDATYTDATIVSYDYGYGRDIQNNITIRYAPRVAGTGSEILWELDTPIEINAGNEKKIRAKFTEQGSDSKVSATTVYKPTEAESTFVYTGGNAVIVSFTPSATSAEIVIKSFSGDITVSTLIVKGIKLTAYNRAEVSARDGANEFYDDRHDLVFDLPILDREIDAQAIADYEISRRAAARGVFYSVTLMNKNAASLTAILARTIGDRVTLSEQQTGHTGDYFIIGEQHTVSNAGTQHMCTWYLESALNSRYWLLGRTGYTELDTTTVLAP